MKYCSQFGATLPLLLSITLLTACGFHPRGQISINNNMETLAISGHNLKYVRALTRELTNSGIKITDMAPYRLKIVKVEKQPMEAFHPSARYYEKCLTLKVVYQLETHDQLTMFDPIELTEERHITENKDLTNAAHSEDILTYNEMTKDLIFRTINRISKISGEKLRQEEDRVRKASILEKSRTNKRLRTE